MFRPASNYGPANPIPAPSSPTKSQITAQNLKRKQYSQDQAKKMLVLQQYFHNKNLNFDACNQLIGSYVQAIEYFDRVQPSMRYYFLQKIQFTLSRPQVVDLLSGKQPNRARDTLNNLRDTLRCTVSQPPPIMQNPVYSKQVSFKKQAQIEYNEEQKKKQRSIKAQMYMEVQQEIKSKTPQLREEFRKLEKTEEQVKDILQNQTTEVERRRQMRKLKRKRNSVDKKKMEEIQEENIPPNANELKEMQKQVNQQIVRYTIRKTAREMEKIKHEEGTNGVENGVENGEKQPQPKPEKEPQPERPQIRETKHGGRINIRMDDDDDD